MTNQKTTNSSKASGLDCRVLVSRRILCRIFRHTADTLFLLGIPHLGHPCFKCSCRLHVVLDENPASDPLLIGLQRRNVEDIECHDQKPIQPPENMSVTSRWRTWLITNHDRQKEMDDAATHTRPRFLLCLRIFARASKSHSSSGLDSAHWNSTRSNGAGQHDPRVVGNRRNRLLAVAGDPSARFSETVLASGRATRGVRLGLVIKVVSLSATKISEYVITTHW